MGGAECSAPGCGVTRRRRSATRQTEASADRCRFGGELGVVTNGAPRDDGAFLCDSPMWNPRQPGVQPIEVSLNALPNRSDFDFVGGRPAPILFTFSRPHTISSVLPTGGPVHGGTRLYVRGTGMLAYARGSHC